MLLWSLSHGQHPSPNNSRGTVDLMASWKVMPAMGLFADRLWPLRSPFLTTTSEPTCQICLKAWKPNLVTIFRSLVHSSPECRAIDISNL
eukprot:6166894-Karenia_brevis.AAC.1